MSPNYATLLRAFRENLISTIKASLAARRCGGRVRVVLHPAAWLGKLCRAELIWTVVDASTG
jgi:hypothetical protein